LAKNHTVGEDEDVFCAFINSDRDGSPGVRAAPGPPHRPVLQVPTLSPTSPAGPTAQPGAAVSQGPSVSTSPTGPSVLLMASPTTACMSPGVLDRAVEALPPGPRRGRCALQSSADNPSSGSLEAVIRQGLSGRGTGRQRGPVQYNTEPRPTAGRLSVPSLFVLCSPAILGVRATVSAACGSLRSL